MSALRDFTCAGNVIAIVGGGPCSFACARSLLEANANVVIFERASRLGIGTPFGSSLGAQALSFNSAEERIGRGLNRLVKNNPGLLHLDDGLLSAGILSRTGERPQGWSRSTGQWEHYILAEGASFETFLRALSGAESDRYEVKVGCEVVKVGKGQGGKWSVTFQQEGKDNVGHFDGVVIAIPAKSTVKLLENSSSEQIWDEHVVKVIRRCSETYVRRHAVLLGLQRGGGVWEKLSERFREVFCGSEGSHGGHRVGIGWGNLAKELNLEGCDGCVSLLSLCKLGEKVVEVVAHGVRGEELDNASMMQFLADWLSLKVEEEVHIIDSNYYEQAKPVVINPNRPLEPLRERGCVVCVAEDEDGNTGRIVAAGDWAAGQGVLSNAISSGFRAAEIVGKSF